MPEEKREPVGMPWWVAILASVVLSALLTLEETGSLVGAAIAAMMALGVGTGGVVVYRRRKGRKNPPTAALSVLLSLAVGLGLVACLGMATGCGASAQQRTVSMAAIAASAADDLAATAWETGAEMIAGQIEAEGVPMAERWPAFCSRAADLYEGTAVAACWARALGNTARAGQRAIDAAEGEMDGPAWANWAGVAAPLAAGLVDAWHGVPDHEPPEELVELVQLLRLFAGEGPPDACEVGPIPGCGEVP